MIRYIRPGAPSLLAVVLCSLCLLSPAVATQAPSDRLLVPGVGFTLAADYGYVAQDVKFLLRLLVANTVLAPQPSSQLIVRRSG